MHTKTVILLENYSLEEFPDVGEIVDVADRRLPAAVIQIVLAIFYGRSSFLLFPYVQVYAVAGMNLLFQRKTIAISFLEFCFVV